MPNPALAQNFVGGITLMPDLAVSGGQNGFGAGENSSPAPNEANTHEWLGSVSKTIGRHVIQVGGGWEEINYGETIRNDTSSFSGSQTANFSGNPINVRAASRPATSTSIPGNIFCRWPHQLARCAAGPPVCHPPRYRQTLWSLKTRRSCMVPK